METERKGKDVLLSGWRINLMAGGAVERVSLVAKILVMMKIWGHQLLV